MREGEREGKRERDRVSERVREGEGVPFLLFLPLSQPLGKRRLPFFYFANSCVGRSLPIFDRSRERRKTNSKRSEKLIYRYFIMKTGKKIKKSSKRKNKVKKIYAERKK